MFKSKTLSNYVIKLFVLATTAILCTFYILHTQNIRDIMEHESAKQTAQVESLILASIRTLIKNSEVLTHSLAQYASNAPLEADKFTQTIPQLLDVPLLKDVVAGGGVWPLPQMFDANQERNSFFWARDQHDNLKFLNDYNNPDAAPYFKEEWFVPAQYARINRCYWSRSYTDPHSHEPMITCSMPIYREDAFWGVATVDIRLSAMSLFIKELMLETGGYAFVIDRNGRFISHPNVHEVQIDGEYTTLEQFANSHAQYKIYNSLIPAEKELSEQPVEALALATKIADSSNDIAQAEALRIIEALGNERDDKPINHHSSRSVHQINDPYLNTPTSIVNFDLPDLGWKLIISIPPQLKSDTYNKVIYPNTILFISILFIIIYTLYSIVSKKVLMPWRTLNNSLKHMYKHPETAQHQVSLNASSKDMKEIEVYYAFLTRTINEAHRTISTHKQGLITLGNSSDNQNALSGPIGLIKGISSFKQQLIKNTYISQLPTTRHALLTAVDDLISLASFDAQIYSHKQEPVVISDFLDVIIKKLETFSTNRNIPIKTVQVDDGINSRMVDCFWLQRILYHLLHNALQFSEAGTVNCSIQKTKNQQTGVDDISFIISNTGALKTPSSDLLSTQIQDLENGTNHQETRLGLAVSLQAAKMMGGSLTLDEDKKSQTVTATLTLPLAECADNIIRDSEHVVSYQSKMPTAPKVLIVDDNPLFLERITAILEADGYKCDVASSALHAKEMLRQNFYHIAFIDSHMPYINGYELVNSIETSMLANTRMAIILMTDQNTLRLNTSALSKNIHHYINKPIDMNDLQFILRMFVSFKDGGRPLPLKKRLEAMHSVPTDRIFALSEPIIEEQLLKGNFTHDHLLDVINKTKADVLSIIALSKEAKPENQKEIKVLLESCKYNCCTLGLKRILLLIQYACDLIEESHMYQASLVLKDIPEAIDSDMQLLEDYVQ